MRLLRLALLAAAALPAGGRADDIPAHLAKRIEDAAPARPQVAPKQPRRVLIFVTPAHLMDRDPHKGYCIPYGTHALRTLGTKTGAFTPVVSQDLAHFLPERIRNFDAIFLNNTSGKWITPTADDLRRAEFRRHGRDADAVERVLRDSLLGYVRGGGGLAALHFAIGGNPHWPAFHDLFGARYAGHPWNEEVGIKLDDPRHPVNAAFAGKGLRLADEIYQFREPYSRESLRVLTSLDTTATNMKVKWIDRTDGDFALGWVKAVGKGRLFYTALGHRTEIYWHPAVLRHYLDGIQFAAGDLPAPTAPSDPGFVSLFNGADLTGWEGDPTIWSVRDGAITGATTADTRLKVNNFLVWKGGRPRDFELRLKYRLLGGNSGIYFHAEKRPSGEPLIGPQADLSADHRWTGVLMEWQKRDVLAERGEQVVIDAAGKKQVVGSVGDPKQLLAAVRDRGWNDYTVSVKGPRVKLKINGVTMCEVTDHDPKRPAVGHLALQVHVGPSMTVQFKAIRLRQD